MTRTSEKDLSPGHEIWITYPLPALIYDARKGVTLSRLLVFDYFVTVLRRNNQPYTKPHTLSLGREWPEPVRGDVLEFVADMIDEAMLKYREGDRGAPARMFNPGGGRISQISPLHRDAYDMLRGSSEERY